MIDELKKARLKAFVQEVGDYEMLFESESFKNWKEKAIDGRLKQLNDEILSHDTSDMEGLQRKVIAHQELKRVTDDWIKKMKHYKEEAQKQL